MYSVSSKAQSCADSRNIGTDIALKAVLTAASDRDDLGASQEVGDYPMCKGVDAIIFPSVVGGDAIFNKLIDAVGRTPE